MINGKNIYENVDNLMSRDTQGWNSNHQTFKQIIETKKPEIIIEVGTWKGASAINMANIIKENELSTKIYCVDTWLGALEFWTDLNGTNERNLLLKNGYPQIYYQFISNVIHTNNQDIITPIPLPSNIAFKVLKYHQILADIIYIDASHEYEDVLSDIRNYLNILKPSGIMFGDDFNTFNGVNRAVIECLTIDKIKIIDNNFWVYEN